MSSLIYSQIKIYIVIVNTSHPSQGPPLKRLSHAFQPLCHMYMSFDFFENLYFEYVLMIDGGCKQPYIILL